MTNEATSKIEEFVKVALLEIQDLKDQLHTYQEKEAAERYKKDQETEAALKKAADALYNSDFITDSEEKEIFLKKAKEDLGYLAKIVERVCTASDVAYMGKVATVKSAGVSEDPVMRRAFGYDQNYSLLDE
jgi:hypothetical protein